MASATGYMTPARTPVQPRKPVATNPLAGAAAGGANPFGLTPGYNPAAYAPGGSSPLVSAAIQSAGMPKAAAPATSTAPSQGNGMVTQYNPGASRTGTQPTAATVYDLNTDPALQQTLSLTGMSDEQAQAAAATARRNLLLNYGDASLASSVLGDPTLASAAAANPTSTLAQLATQRTQGIQDLTEQMNQANLLYSGYRTTQETKAAQDYQNALASAASGIDTSLQGVTGSLNQALGQNAAARATAESDAANRAIQAALLAPPVAGGGGATVDPTTGLALGMPTGGQMPTAQLMPYIRKPATSPGILM